MGITLKSCRNVVERSDFVLAVLNQPALLLRSSIFDVIRYSTETFTFEVLCDYTTYSGVGPVCNCEQSLLSHSSLQYLISRNSASKCLYTFISF